MGMERISEFSAFVLDSIRCNVDGFSCRYAYKCWKYNNRYDSKRKCFFLNIHSQQYWIVCFGWKKNLERKEQCNWKWENKTVSCYIHTYIFIDSCSTLGVNIMHNKHVRNEIYYYCYLPSIKWFPISWTFSQYSGNSGMCERFPYNPYTIVPAPVPS